MTDEKSGSAHVVRGLPHGPGGLAPVAATPVTPSASCPWRPSRIPAPSSPVPGSALRRARCREIRERVRPSTGCMHSLSPAYAYSDEVRMKNEANTLWIR